MTPNDLLEKRSNVTSLTTLDSTDFHWASTNTYECRVVIMPEEDEDGFSVIATDLPGVASQGETEEEAIENIKEAFIGAISIYLEAGDIPWADNTPEGLPLETPKRWVVVNVENPVD